MRATAEAMRALDDEHVFLVGLRGAVQPSKRDQVQERIDAIRRARQHFADLVSRENDRIATLPDAQDETSPEPRIAVLGWVKVRDRLPPCKPDSIVSEDVLVMDERGKLYVDRAYYDWKPSEREFWGYQMFVPQMYGRAVKWMTLADAHALLSGGPASQLPGIAQDTRCQEQLEPSEEA